MNEHKNHDPVDRMLDEAFGDAAVPDPGSSVWSAVQARTVPRRGGVWLPRLVATTAVAACLAVGFMAGARWIPGGAGEKNWLTTDDVVTGSLWDETSWSLDGLYASVETTTDTGGGER